MCSGQVSESRLDRPFRRSSAAEPASQPIARPIPLPSDPPNSAHPDSDHPRDLVRRPLSVNERASDLPESESIVPGQTGEHARGGLLGHD